MGQGDYSAVISSEARNLSQIENVLPTRTEPLPVLDEKLTAARAASSAAHLEHAPRLYQAYATSHDDPDKDEALFAEVKNAALAQANMVKVIRTGKYHAPDEKLHDPREI